MADTDTQQSNSGTDVVETKFQIPEMVFAETYGHMETLLGDRSRAPSTSSEAPSRPAQAALILSKNRKKKTRVMDDNGDDGEFQLLAKCMRIISKDDKEKDPCDAFGEHVASQLKRYRNDEILRIQTENAIQKVLIDASEKYLAKNFE